jgi:hypothetical protein
MSGTALDHPLVRDYLRDLGRALAALPAEQATELTEQITAHLDEALLPGTTDDEIAVVLARLGRPADLAGEAIADLAGAPARPARRRSRLHWLRLGWRRWTAIGAAVLIVAATAGYVIAMATATPIQFANVTAWWFKPDYNREIDTQADGRQQSTVPIRSGRRQAFVITIINPSGWPETVLGPAPGQAGPGSRSVQIGVSPLNVDNGGFPTRRLRFYRPFTISPHQIRILRVIWTSTICLRRDRTNGIGHLALRVRVGWLTRTEVVQLPQDFYLSGPSRGPCT